MDEATLNLKLTLDPDGYSRSIYNMARQRFQYMTFQENPRDASLVNFIRNDYRVWLEFFSKRP